MTTHVVTDEKLGVLARRQNDLFRRVREGTLPIEAVLRALQDTIEGNFDAIPVGPRRLIDCDVMPYIPDGWTVNTHHKGGEIEFDPAKVQFYQSKRQKSGGTIPIKDLIAETEGKRRGNACILDHLLANSNLIPEDWKFNEDGSIRYIYFMDTQYSVEGGGVYVRSLSWRARQWDWGFDHLGSGVGAQVVVFILGE